MPYCPNCGTEVEENVKFCEKCGSKAEETKTEIPVTETPILEEVKPDPKAEEQIAQRKIEVGKEIVEKYSKQSTIFTFPLIHEKSFNIIRNLLFSGFGLIFGCLHYFIFYYKGIFEIEPFGVCLISTFIFCLSVGIFIITPITELIYVLYSSSWLKKNSYQENKPCNSNYAFQSVVLYKEKGMYFLQKELVLEQACLIVSVIHAFIFQKHPKGKLTFILYLIGRCVCSVLNIILAVPFNFISIIFFTNIVINGIKNWKAPLSPLFLFIAILILFSFLILSLLDNVLVKLFVKKYNGFEKELVEQYKDVKEE